MRKNKSIKQLIEKGYNVLLHPTKGYRVFKKLHDTVLKCNQYLTTKEILSIKYKKEINVSN